MVLIRFNFIIRKLGREVYLMRSVNGADPQAP